MKTEEKIGVWSGIIAVSTAFCYLLYLAHVPVNLIITSLFLVAFLVSSVVWAFFAVLFDDRGWKDSSGSFVACVIAGSLFCLLTFAILMWF